MTNFHNLRDYQKQDVQFLSSLKAAALFNEQRTGKTPTALALMHMHGVTKILIVCPATAIYPWVDEFELWMGQPCLACVGLPATRKDILARWKRGDAAGLVISYDMLKLIERGDKETGELFAVLDCKPQGIIIDEAHRIRNHTTATAKAIFSFARVTGYKLALTGTPAMNKPQEIWSILHFLYPNTFKHYWPFIDSYFQTVLRRNPVTGAAYKDIGDLNKKGKELMLQVLPRISVNRKRKDVMPWLPPKDYITVRLPLTTYQRKYLDELEEVWETEEVVTIGVLDRLIRYRQVCLDPGLIDLKGASPKTEWVLQYVRDYPDVPTILFSKFTSYLNRIAPLIPGVELITGATPVVRRREICKQFQAGKLNFLLLNIDACKEALTLDRAEAAIFTDKYPPVGDIAQAEDRFVSTTEDKKDKPHRIYDLVMRDSYDETIVQMIAARFGVTDIINNYRKYIERRKN